MARKRSRRRRRTRRNPGRVAASNPVRRRRGRRRFRRNPFRIGGGNIVNKVVRGARDAGAVVVGKAIARGVPKLVGLPTVGFMGTAVQALAGIFLAPIAGKFLGGFIGRDSERFILAGALLAPIESVIAGLPVIGPLLGEYDYLAAIPADYSPSDLIGAGGEDVLAAYTEEQMGGYLSPVF